MMKELGVSPHNMSQCSILMADGILFVCTSNAVDSSIVWIRKPARRIGRMVYLPNLGVRH